MKRRKQEENSRIRRKNKRRMRRKNKRGMRRRNKGIMRRRKKIAKKGEEGKENEVAGGNVTKGRSYRIMF